MEGETVGPLTELKCLQACAKHRRSVGRDARLLADFNQHLDRGTMRRGAHEGQGHRFHIGRWIAGSTASKRVHTPYEIRSANVPHNALRELGEVLEHIGRIKIEAPCKIRSRRSTASTVTAPGV